MRKFAACLAATLFITVFSIVPASAHDTLVSMTPARDSVSYSVPTQVVLTFDEKISPNGDGLTVTAPDGARVDVGTPTVMNTKLSVNLGPIRLNGHYLVNYRVVSADGHPVEASAGFEILVATLAATAKAKIDVSGEGESGVEKGEGRSGTEKDLTIAYYVLFAALLGGLYIYWRKRRNRVGNR